MGIVSTLKESGVLPKKNPQAEASQVVIPAVEDRVALLEGFVQLVAERR